MSDHSKIEWTDASWNPIRARSRLNMKVGWHCEKVSAACANCYAENFNQRLGTQLEYKGGMRFGNTRAVDIFLDEKTLLQPLKWRRPRRIFVCSMTDIFGDWVTDEMLDRIFAVMALCPQHTFQVLTKRSERMRKYACEWFMRMALNDPEISHPAGSAKFSSLVDFSLLPAVLPNVWLGVTAENQQTADKRIPDLLATPAAVRFVSIEPHLELVDLTTINVGEGEMDSLRELSWKEIWDMQWSPLATSVPHDEALESFLDWYSLSEMPEGLAHPKLDWVICGGESGPHARPMHPDWARSLRDQCAAASVPFFFKQMAKKAPIPDDLMIREFPHANT